MYYIGIDLGGTVIKVGLVTGGMVVGTARIEADSIHGLLPKLEPMTRIINDLLEANDIKGSELGGVAVAFPGIVNVSESRVIATNAKYDDAPQVNMQEWARKNWAVPLVMDNDARMATVGEWQFGAGKGKNNIVMMTIGTGVGTGVILDGRLLYGSNFCAGSLGGHMIVDYKGRKCTCGNKGCVEAHGSYFFLPDIIKDNKDVSDTFKRDAKTYTFKNLFEKMQDGDKNATIVLTECMDVWSAAIINYVHAYDPELVVMGGGIMKSADIILPYVREKVNSLAWRPCEKVAILSSQLGDDAALAAASYYFEKLK